MKPGVVGAELAATLPVPLEPIRVIQEKLVRHALRDRVPGSSQFLSDCGAVKA
jgi:hypothetical protein